MSEFDSPSDIERFNKIMKQFRQEDAAKVAASVPASAAELLRANEIVELERQRDAESNKTLRAIYQQKIDALTPKSPPTKTLTESEKTALRLRAAADAVRGNPWLKGKVNVSDQMRLLKGDKERALALKAEADKVNGADEPAYTFRNPHASLV